MMSLESVRPGIARISLALLLVAQLAAVQISPAWSEPSPEQMVHLEFTIDKSTIPADSFARKPINVWRSGEKYLTVLESPDYVNGMHGMTISNEPDNWMVNHFTKSAKHIVDRSPTQVVHAAIFSFSKSEELQKLEFGKEVEFFTARGVKPLDAGKYRDADSDRYETEIDGAPLRLIVDRQKKIPLRLELTEPDGVTAIEFKKYESAAKFDASIFKLPAGVTSEEVPESNPEQAALKHPWVEEYATHYYLHPDPSKIADAIKALNDDFDVRSAVPLSAFYAEVMRKNPKLVHGWVEAAKPLKPDVRFFMYVTLRQCGSDTCLAELKTNPYGFAKEGMDEFVASKQPSSEVVPLDSPTSLDFLWGEFMASGSEIAPRRISKLVAEKWPQVDAKSLPMPEMLVVGAARWSLIANAKQHPVVRRILEEESKKSPELLAMLAEVDSNEEKESPADPAPEPVPVSSPSLP